jgi:hypothetical protein
MKGMNEMKQDSIASIKKTAIMELVLVIAISSIFVLMITIGLGTMSSGWHLVDDHQFFGYIDQFRNHNKSLWEVIGSELRRDAIQQHRARFLYYPFRVLQAYLFGYNYVYYNIVKAVEGIIALSYLYYVGKELKLSRYLSAVFAVIVLCGYQGAVLWKLGPQHLQSTMFMAMGLYYMMVYLRSGKRRTFAFCMICITLMACFHESFVVTIPFIIAFLIYGELKEDIRSGNLSFAGVLKAVRDNRGLLIGLAAVFVLIMLYIALFLGIFSYGVVKENVPVSDILKNLEDGFIKGDFSNYFSFGIMLLIVLASYYESIKPVWPELVLAAAFAFPQIMLYTSEPFYERYLLPLTFGWALFFVANYGNGIVHGVRRTIYVLLLTIMAILQIRITVVEADYYRFRGDSVTTMLDETLSLMEKGYNVTSVLGISNPEADMTMSSFFKSHLQKNCWYWHEYDAAICEAPPFSSEADGELHSVSDVDVFVAYNRDDRHFTVEPSLDLAKFHRVKCGSLDLYFSDEAYITLTDEDFERFKIKPTIYGIGADD